MNEFQCVNLKCKKFFKPNYEQQIVKNGKKIIRCPWCKTKYIKINISKDFIKMPSGQLINKKKKIKMSKKERLKLRKKKNGTS